MLTPPAGLKVYVATRPVDFRRGANTLATFAKEVLGQDPFSGVALVFRSKRADRVKILAWDGTGLVLYWKLPERTFTVRDEHSVQNGAFAFICRDEQDIATRAHSCMIAAMIETDDSSNLLPNTLPADPEALRIFALELIAERNVVVTRCKRLEHLLRVAKHARFGHSSEKLNADQLQLVLEDVDQAVAAIEAEENRDNPAKARERAATRRRSRRSRHGSTNG